MQQTLTPFEWSVQHLQVIGWPILVLLAFRISRFLTRVEDMVKIKVVQFDELHTAVTNHLSHATQEAADAILTLANNQKEMIETVERCATEGCAHEDAGHHEIAVSLEKLGDRLTSDGRETRETIRAYMR